MIVRGVDWLCGCAGGFVMLAPRSIDEYILPTERRVLRVRAHWVVMASDFAQATLVLVALIAVDGYVPSSPVVDTLTWYAGLVLVVRLSLLTALWWVQRVVFTDKRVMISTGIITHRIAMMPLGKVTDLTFRRSFLARVIGYGTIVIESAGQIQGLDQIDYLPRPEEAYEALTELIFGDKKQTRSHLLPKPRR
jgi:uncharacterized membrane protein YdbT with pleckstrin-like domain